MADISRIASPMSLCEEDLFDVTKKVEKKKKELLKLQKTKPAAFLVGSIQRVNERICNLDSELSKYDNKLAIEIKSPINEEVYDPATGTFSHKNFSRRSTRSAKEREERATQKFAGKFSQESTFSIDFQDEWKVKKKNTAPAKKSDAPRLVELQQYPGFSGRVTPLPHSLEATSVLDHVMSAQNHLRKKPTYCKEFSKMIYSQTQRSILQDTFWWFFINKYHPSAENQSNLFKRIAKHFVRFLLMSTNPKFRDTFFMSYANILAQSVYSAFCLAFPQSWRQFHDPQFKETLISVTTIWINGIKPPPRLYEKWNYVYLEPKGMRKEENMKLKTEKRSQTATTSAGKISPSVSSFSSKTQSRSGSNKDMFRRTKSDALSTVSSLKTRSNETTDKALSTITEIPKSIDDENKMYSKPCTPSSALGRSAEFDRCVFNLYGRSPLFDEYLHQRGLNRRAGTDHLVRRTQIDSYPDKTAPTFKACVIESSNIIKETTANFNRTYSFYEKTSNEFANKLADEHKKFNMKANKILGRPRQVRYLSNLLLMEMKKSADETKVIGANAALNAAISSESAN